VGKVNIANCQTYHILSNQYSFQFLQTTTGVHPDCKSILFLCKYNALSFNDVRQTHHILSSCL